MKPNRIAAFIAWLVSVWFTALFLSNAGELGYILAGSLAFVMQAVLTIAERPLWRWILRRDGGKLVLAGLVITLLDGTINAAGMYPLVPRFGTSGIGFMLVDAFNLNPRIDKLTAISIAMFFGTLVAGLAEYLWELE